MAVNVKFLTGDKAKIDNQISLGLIDNGDIILTADTDEMVFMNPNGEKRVIQTKTQEDHTLVGGGLGGLKEGSIIKAGTSLDELLKMITQIRVPAKYTQPKISLTLQGDIDNFEVGTKVPLNLKSIFIQNDAGPLERHSIFKDGQVLIQSVKLSELDGLEDIVLTDDLIVYHSEASYLRGNLKDDNFGEPSEGRIEAGTIRSEDFQLQGKRYLFYGAAAELENLDSSTIRNLDSRMVAPSGNASFTIPVEIGQKYVIFAYPSEIKDVEQIMYVETNDTSMASSFDKTLIEVEGANGFTAKEYKVYTYQMAIPAPAPMTFKVTI